MKFLAIIPARGGSKRIPHKNVKPFVGVPVIAYSIRAALQSGCFDEVMVSTDDPEIAETARRYGAKVPFMRSAETADDFATTADVIREVLQRYEADGCSFDAFACIYATAPFITADRLCSAADILTRRRAEAAFTCVEYSYPTQRCLVIGDSGRIGMLHPEYAKSRSQDLRKTYHDAGQFYFSTVEAFRRTGTLWGPDTLPIILPELEVQDLDTPTDWRMAEIKYSLLSMPGEFSTESYRFITYPRMSQEVSRRVFEGRNEPDVRSFMVNQEPIAFSDHLAFVESLATRRDKQYYAVFTLDGQFVGSVNMERIDEQSMERGIWIDASARRQGHAHRLLSQLYAYFAEVRDLRRVVTKVRIDNVASLALETSLGARESHRDDEYVYFDTFIQS